MGRTLAFLLLYTAAAAAAPGASLTGVDMRSEHAARRDALARELGEGTLVLFAAPRRGYGDYRPEPNLFYLTGVEASEAALVLHVEYPEATERARRARVLADPLEDTMSELRRITMIAARSGDRETVALLDKERKRAAEARQEAIALYETERGHPRLSTRLYLPPASPRGHTWTDGLRAGEEATILTGIEDVRSVRVLYRDLGALLVTDSRLYFPSDSLLPRSARDWRDRLRTRLFRRSPARAIQKVRGVKSTEEIARIRKACELTARGLVECMREARPGMFEYELQARLEFVCRRGGARRQAFASIVGSGPNTLVLHYDDNSRRTEADDLVLMDVGAEYMGYAADVTRTFPVSGRFSERQAEVYDVVLAAQRAAIAAVRPGATFRDVDAAARQVIAKAGHAKGIAHSVGHYVGLDVHDPAPGRPFEPGNVITVEPGLYLAREGIGIRIEDTVLVTKDGAEVLSAGVPKERAEIEALRAE